MLDASDTATGRSNRRAVLNDSAGRSGAKFPIAVARIERSEIRESTSARMASRVSLALNPGYTATTRALPPHARPRLGLAEDREAALHLQRIGAVRRDAAIVGIAVVGVVEMTDISIP